MNSAYKCWIREVLFYLENVRHNLVFFKKVQKANC